MTRYIISILLILGLWACTEDKDVLELNAAPSVVDYQNYAATVNQGAEWSSGLPLVRGEGKMTYSLLSVSYLALEAEEAVVIEAHPFTMDGSGLIALPVDNLLELGTYTIAVEVSNDYGTLLNNEAIKLEVVEDLLPVISIQTPTGTNEIELLVNPAGEPVDEVGNVLEGLLPGVSILFANMGIEEVLMTPVDVFTFGRESDYVEEGATDIGVVKMVGPFEVGTYTLTFTGTVSQPEVAQLLVNVKKLNLPYDQAIFAMDLSGEDTGPRNDQPETLVGGLQMHLIYGALKSGRAFWNVQADKNHPLDEFDATPILRWLAFNADLGYDTETANKSQSIVILNEVVDVRDVQEVRVDASFLANKAAELTSGLLRCDIRVCTEEEYQAMLAMATQDEKKAAVNSWQQVATSLGTTPTAGTDENTGYGYFEMAATIDKASLPISASNQLRFMFHMVADKDGPNPGYLAPQSFNIEGTFLDSE
ncbi:hypothetical protein KEM09_02620 [Carboxylicivirga mesophila]|uniref:DUF4925 domain-containing protein n=1 Tax=Carboxylicivirga mesophila TaxID=1166478 RepID=A0ABS5K7D4_9BACT|nr:hypothetical protein [Carboxylicivirga mesophila]MBS2210273.1 hypothetical protein [Carboxylicivirga mesophila]